MSDNNQPLSSNTISPLQRVSLNSSITNLVLDSDSGNSSLVVKTGTTSSLYIDKYSNVGINTTSPGAQLEVASNNGSCLRLRYGTSTSAFANIFMSNGGNLSINPSGSEINTTTSLNLVNHDGTSSGLKLGGVLVTATAAQLNYTAVVSGSASPSKAVVLDSTSSVTGITSISATSLTGTLQTANQPNITSLGSLSSLTVMGSLTVNGSLFVNGTTTSVNSTSIAIQDNTLLLNASPIGPVDSGIIIRRFQSSNDISTGSVITDTPSLITTSTSATSTTITLATGSSIDNYYQGWWVKSGSQVRKVLSYVGTTNTITVDNVLTTTISNGSSVSLFNRTFASMIWSESNKQFMAAFTANDSTSNLTIIDKADLAASNITASSVTTTGNITTTNIAASGRIAVADTTESSSVITGSMVLSGGAGIAKNLYVGGNVYGTNLYGTVQTAAQPFITSLGALTSLVVTNGVTASTLTGIIQTAAQPNITSIGTLTSPLGIQTTSNNGVTITNTNNASSSSLKFVGDTYAGEIGIRGTSNSSNQSKFYISYNNFNSLLIDTSGNVSLGYNLNIGGSLNATSYSVGGTALTTSVISGPITAGSAVAGKVLSVDPSLNVSGIMSLTASNLIGSTSLTIGSSTLSSTDASYLSGLTAGSAVASKALILDSSRNISNVGAISSTFTNDSTTLSAIHTWTNHLATDMVVKLQASNLAPVFGTTSNHKMQFAANNAASMYLQTSGNVSIGADLDTFKLSVSGSINATGYYLNGTIVDLPSVAYVSGLSIGTATAGKALIVDSNTSIKGISSITTNSITLGSTVLSETQAMYISGTPGSATANQVMILGPTKSITGINSLSAATLIVNGVDIYSALSSTMSSSNSSSVYLTGITNGTASPSKALVVDTNNNIGSINALGATTLTLGTNTIGSTEAGYLTSITSGSAAAGKALVLSGTGGISGIVSLTTSSITLGTNTLGSTEAGYLTSLTIGTASASKAVVLDTNKGISGLGAVSVSGSGNILTLTNTTNTGYVAQSFVSDSYSLTIGATGSTNTNPNTAYLSYNGTYMIRMNATGNVSIGTNTFGFGLNVGGTLNATNYYLNGNILDLSGLSYITGISSGAAAPSKALVLSSTGTITNITSLSSSTIIVAGFSISGEAAYLSGSTPGGASNNKALVLNSSGNITSGINSLTMTSLVLGTASLGATEAGYLTSIATVGTAYASKAVVLDGSKSITGINAISASSLTLGTSTTLTTTEAGYLTTISVGTASAGKAVVLDAGKNITGINSIGLTSDGSLITLTNATTSTSRTTIKFVNDTQTYELGTACSGNTSYPAGAFYLYDSTTPNVRLMVSPTTGNVAIGATTASDKLNVNGVVNATGYKISGTAYDLSLVSLLSGVTAGTATASKALIVDPSCNITNIGNLTATGSILVNGLSTSTASISNTTASTSSTTGALLVSGGIGVNAMSYLNGISSTTATISNSTASTSTTTGALTVSGGIGANAMSYFNGLSTSTASISSTTASTSTTTGALTVSGGIGAAGMSYFNSIKLLQISSGANNALEIKNTTATGNSNILFTSNLGNSFELGIRGSASTVPTQSFYIYDLANTPGMRFFIDTTGNVVIGSSITTSYKLSVTGSFNATSYYLNGVLFDPTVITGITAGTATASKSLILDASARITTGLRGLTIGGLTTTLSSGTDFRNINSATATFTNNYTAASGTESTHISNNYFTAPALAATNTGVATTTASTMFINGAPTAGSNMTITNSYGLYVNGNSYFNDNVGIGTLSPAYKLDVNGTINATQIYINGAAISTSSPYTTTITPGTATASQALVVDSNLNIAGINSLSTSNLITNGTLITVGGLNWSLQTSAADNYWTSVCWSPELGLFVAVSNTGTARVATSTNGSTWTIRTDSVAAANAWASVCWSPDLGLLLAVGSSVAMISSNGITWTSVSIGTYAWISACWSSENGVFVAIANGYANHSFNGSTWYGITSIFTKPAASAWTSICWAREVSKFVIVANTGSNKVGNGAFSNIYNSTNWTSSNTTVASACSWSSVCWSSQLGLFVAVANSGTYRVMTSSDGINWTSQTSFVAASMALSSVCWCPELGLFVAVSRSGAITSPDGIAWTSQTTLANTWSSVCWSPELSTITAVGQTGTGNRVMTSIHNPTSQINLLTNTQTQNTSILGLDVDVHLRYNGGLNGTHRWFNTTTTSNSNELMRLNSTGLGIGVLTPRKKIDIQSPTGDLMRLRMTGTNYIDIGLNSSKILSFTNGGSYSFDNSVTAGNTSGGDLLIATNGTVVSTIQLSSSVAYVGTTSAHNFAIQTSNLTRMTFDTNGYVGIAETVPLYPLHISSTVTASSAYSYYFYTSPTGSNGKTTSDTVATNVSAYLAGRLMCNGEVDVISDRRTKENIEDINNDMANYFLTTITPKRFIYKSETGKSNFGYIAQDLVKAGLVELLSDHPNPDMEETTDEDGFVSPAGIEFSVTTGNIIPLFHLKLNQLSDENKQLQQKNEDLEARISRLESLLNNQ